MLASFGRTAVPVYRKPVVAILATGDELVEPGGERLPGNPVAAMVGFEMFVRPALLAMMGHTRIIRPLVRAVASEQIVNKGDRPQSDSDSGGTKSGEILSQDHRRSGVGTTFVTDAWQRSCPCSSGG